MAKRMSKGMLALSSAAIASVYGVGYVVTQPAAVSMAAGVAPASDSNAADPTATATTPASGTSASPSAGPAGTTASAGLKDGTYSGTGWSRHGSVSVSVTVQNGKITAAPITGVTTRYSQSVISGLP
ncbi:MAG: FMN-binding protein, partial [Chloroflexi bacterium]|nr:FMN-binding protein [Chloroflexota bacterium]